MLYKSTQNTKSRYLSPNFILYFHFWLCQGKLSQEPHPKGGTDDLGVENPPHSPLDPPAPQPHSSSTLLLPAAPPSKLAETSHTGQQLTHREGRSRTGVGVPRRPPKASQPNKFQACLAMTSAAVEKREEPQSVQPAPGSPLDTTGLLTLGGKASGTERGQRRCGDLEWHESEQGLRSEAGRDPSGPLLRKTK